MGFFSSLFGKKELHIFNPEANELEFLAARTEQEGDINKASSLYKKSINICETYTNLYNYGRVLNNYQKEHYKSIKYFNKSIKISPRSDTYLELGNAYYMLKQIDNAIKAWKYSVKTEPNFLKGFLQLWVIHLENGNKSKAMKYAKLASKLGHEEATRWIKMALTLGHEEATKRIKE